MAASLIQPRVGPDLPLIFISGVILFGRLSRTFNVHHPRDAKFIHAHTKGITPRGPLQGHRHGSTPANMCPVLPEVYFIIAFKREANGVARRVVGSIR